MEKNAFITQGIKHPFKKDYFEKLAQRYQVLVCGIDEVGRGCLAGPVVASAVIIKPHSGRKSLIDSKLLSPEERLTCYTWLMKNSWHATAFVCPQTIDQINIYQATLKAMRRAVAQLTAASNLTPAIILVDAMPLVLPMLAPPEGPNLTLEGPLEGMPTELLGKILHFPFGEKRSRSIAAASIVAKVTRDRLMERLTQRHPPYGLERHKGYGTPQHQQRLHVHGPSTIHRKEYLPEETGLEVENLSIPFDQPFSTPEDCCE